jgi:hypothetical protein
LIAARRFLRPEKGHRILPHRDRRPLELEERAAAAADGIEVKTVPHLHQAG